MKNLPVEIWRYILLYAISVPHFFSNDPVPNKRPQNEDEYWASERTRNALRRVCSSWDHFLTPLDGRYVRTSDIIHDMAWAGQLARALRIKMDDCDCTLCKLSVGEDSQLAEESSRFLDQVSLADSANNQAPWRVETMDVGTVSYLDIIASKPSRLSNLGALYLQGEFLTENFITASPPLSTLMARGSDILKLERMNLSQIVTLTLWYVHPATLLQLYFPNLIHARFRMHMRAWMAQTSTNFLGEWLKLHGRNLETLYWEGCDASRTKVDVATIWQLCPRLRRLQLPHGTLWMPSTSPTKFQLLRVAYCRLANPDTLCPYRDHRHRKLVQFSDCLALVAKSGTQTIETSWQWRQMLVDRDNCGLLCFWKRAKAHQIVAVDSSGSTLEQAIVAYLEGWKGVISGS